MVTVVQWLANAAHVSLINSCAISFPGVATVTGHAGAAWNVPDGAAFVPATLIMPPVAVRGAMLAW